MAFDRNLQKASFELRYDADGRVYAQAVATGGATLNTPYKIQVDEYGYFAEPLTDGTETYMVGVPDHTVTSGDTDWFQVGGRVTGLITPTLSVSVGHALGISTGVVADIGADYSGGATEFAVCRTVSTSATTQDVVLVPREITEAS